PVSFPAPSNGLAMAPLAYQPQAPRAAYAVQPAYAAPAPSASYPPARRKWRRRQHNDAYQGY
ncbi:MAG TPA: hypothetical protein VL688_02100, partial [Verrucomicrobiae bacterium]|nr:hypothetical protein [Verrucomicrobiae bacterium]